MLPAMKMKNIFLMSVCCIISYAAQAQTTDIVLLQAQEMTRLRMLKSVNVQVKVHCDSIIRQANQHLRSEPRPLTHLYYEGLLQTNPDRIDTRKSLEDVDKVVDFIYAYYSSNDNRYAQKATKFVVAWADTYQITGNTINENKFVPLFWAHYLFRDQFSKKEKRKVENWMRGIAQAQYDRPRTPNNNWEAKRQKIIATVGCILEDKIFQEAAVKGFMQYIQTAYYADGTSNDLKQRDALSYHMSGLKPAIGTFVNCVPFSSALDLYTYLTPDGASIKRSVEYTLPYAQGEKKRAEWTHSKVELDQKRAAAGLAEYQPGMLFDPKKAIPLFEWAAYYQPEWFALLGKGTAEDNYTATWLGLLNSPLVRRH